VIKYPTYLQKESLYGSSSRRRYFISTASEHGLAISRELR